MKKIWKKTLAMVLAVLMLVSVLPFSALADDIMNQVSYNKGDKPVRVYAGSADGTNWDDYDFSGGSLVLEGTDLDLGVTDEFGLDENFDGLDYYYKLKPGSVEGETNLYYYDPILSGERLLGPWSYTTEDGNDALSVDFTAQDTVAGTSLQFTRDAFDTATADRATSLILDFNARVGDVIVVRGLKITGYSTASPTNNNVSAAIQIGHDYGSYETACALVVDSDSSGAYNFYCDVTHSNLDGDYSNNACLRLLLTAESSVDSATASFDSIDIYPGVNADMVQDIAHHVTFSTTDTAQRTSFLTLNAYTNFLEWNKDGADLADTALYINHTSKPLSITTGTDEIAAITGWQISGTNTVALDLEHIAATWTGNASVGQKVLLDITPAAGLSVTGVTLTYADGYSVPVVKNGGYYEFTMPNADDAVVSVTTGSATNVLTVDVADAELAAVPQAWQTIGGVTNNLSLTDADDDDRWTANAVAGESTTLRVAPASGFRVTGVTLSYAGGYSVPVNADENGYYTFTMPNAEDVLITVSTSTAVRSLTVDYTGANLAAAPQAWQTIGGVTNNLTLTYADEKILTANAVAGETTSLRITPVLSETLTSVILEYANGYAVSVNADENGYYTFTMPDYDDVKIIIESSPIARTLSISVPAGVAAADGVSVWQTNAEGNIRPHLVIYDSGTNTWSSPAVVGQETSVGITTVPDANKITGASLSCANGYTTPLTADAVTGYYTFTMPDTASTMTVFTEDYTGYYLDMNPTTSYVDVGVSYNLQSVGLSVCAPDSEFVKTLNPRADGAWYYLDGNGVYQPVPTRDANSYQYIDTADRPTYGLNNVGEGVITLRFVSNLPLATAVNPMFPFLYTGEFKLHVGIPATDLVEARMVPVTTFDDADALDIALSAADDTVKLSDYIRVTKITDDGGVILTQGTDFTWCIAPANGRATINGDILTFVDDPYLQGYNNGSSFTFEIWAKLSNGIETDRQTIRVLASRDPLEVTVANPSDLFDYGDKSFYVLGDVTGNTFDLDTLSVYVTDQYGKIFTVSDARTDTKTTMTLNNQTYAFDWADGDGVLTWYVSKDGAAATALPGGDWTANDVGVYTFYATIGDDTPGYDYKFAQSDPFTVTVKAERTVKDENATVAISYPEDHSYMTLYWDGTPEQKVASLKGLTPAIELSIKDQYGDDVGVEFLETDNQLKLTFSNGTTETLTAADYGWVLGKNGTNKVATITDNAITGEYVGSDSIYFWVKYTSAGSEEVTLSSNVLDFRVMSIETPFEFYYNGGADFVREGVPYDLYAELCDFLYVRDQYGNSQTLSSYVGKTGNELDTYLREHLVWTLRDGRATTVDAVDLTQIRDIEDGALFVENGAIGDKQEKQVVVEATLNGLVAEHIWLYVREVQAETTAVITSPVEFVPLTDNVNVRRFTVAVYDQYADLMYTVTTDDDGDVTATAPDGTVVEGVTLDWSTDGTYLTIDPADTTIVGAAESIAEANGKTGHSGWLYVDVLKGGTTAVTGSLNLPVYGVAKIVSVDVLNCWTWAKPGESVDLSTLNVVVKDQYGNAYSGTRLAALLNDYKAEIRWGISNADTTTAYIENGVLYFGTGRGEVVLACMVVNSINFEMLKKIEKPIPVQPDPPMTYLTITATATEGGSISPAGVITVPVGGSKTFAIVANDGYALESLLVDGKSVALTSTYGFSDIRANHTIHAVFSDNKDHTAFIQGSAAGTFNPLSSMTRAEAAAIFARLLSGKMQLTGYPSTFSDVEPGSWYASYVGYLERFGIIGGYGDGTFNPGAPVTRAEFCAMASRYAQLTAVDGKSVFSDVDGHWADGLITACYAKGWIEGYSDLTFKPNNNITRAEVVAIVCRMLDRKIDADALTGLTYKTFPDVSDTNYWAYYYIIEAANTHTYKIVDGEEIWTAV